MPIPDEKARGRVDGSVGNGVGAVDAAVDLALRVVRQIEAVVLLIITGCLEYNIQRFNKILLGYFL